MGILIFILVIYALDVFVAYQWKSFFERRKIFKKDKATLDSQIGNAMNAARRGDLAQTIRWQSLAKDTYRKMYGEEL